MRHITGFILLLIFVSCSSQTSFDKMILQLKQSEFGDVLEARDSIMNYGDQSVSKLIELLRDTSFVKLKNIYIEA